MTLGTSREHVLRVDHEEGVISATENSSQLVPAIPRYKVRQCLIDRKLVLTDVKLVDPCCADNIEVRRVIRIHKYRPKLTWIGYGRRGRQGRPASVYKFS